MGWFHQCETSSGESPDVNVATRIPPSAYKKTNFAM
jgi:hypothetical protein